MAEFRCFWACWESFVPDGPGGGCCWESFVPVEPGGGCCWESFVPGEWWIGGGTGRKFSLRGGVVLEAGGNSPCVLEMAGFWCFWAYWESFVPVGPGGGCCWESFVPGEWWIGVGSGRKFSLLGGVVVEPGENSPCSREMAGFRCFWACRESFVPVGPVRGARWGRVCCVEPH